MAPQADCQESGPVADGAPRECHLSPNGVGRCVNYGYESIARSAKPALLARKLPPSGLTMKTIGVIGGMSWQSTLQYYRLMNELVHARLGGAHSAKLLLANVDFHEIEAMQRAGAWAEAGELLRGYAVALERAGAQTLLIAANTMHKVAPAVEAAIRIPLLHVADVTGAAVRNRGGRQAALLGTRFTMEQSFYRDRLLEKAGLPVVVPAEDDRAIIHRIIYEELCHGLIRPESREQFRRIILNLVGQGADSVILGCTEISLLVGAEDSPVPVYDTTAIHATAAVDWALA